MKTITKGLVGTVAAGAMVLGAASPAYAKHDRDGIDAGDIIAGALIIGGIAAVAAAASDNDRGRGDYGRDYDYDRGGYDRGGYDRGYDRGRGGGYGGNSRDAVERCVNAAENQASRYSYGRADVTDIRSIDRTRGGFTIKGRIAVNSRGQAWRQGDRRYGDGWGNDYRGWNRNLSGYDSGKFTCRVQNGRVVDVDFSGIRGLR